jgi:heme A synthase
LHPFLSLGVGGWLVTLAWRSRKGKGEGPARRCAGGVIALVATQSLVGAANVALLAPIALQLVHLLLADLLWIALVLLAAATRGSLAASALAARPAAAAGRA